MKKGKAPEFQLILLVQSLDEYVLKAYQQVTENPIGYRFHCKVLCTTKLAPFQKGV